MNMTDLNVYPATNQKVVVIAKTGPLSALKIHAVVLSVNCENVLRLYLPKKLNTNADQVKPGLSVTMEFSNQKGYFTIEATVREIESYSGEEEGQEGYLLLLDSFHDLKKSNRRRFFRLPVSFPLTFKRAYLKYSGFTFDISGSGLSMVTEAPLTQGDEIVLDIQIQSLQLKLSGKVIWCRKTRFQDPSVQTVGVDFLGIRKDEQDLIVEFIFNRQRTNSRIRLEGSV